MARHINVAFDIDAVDVLKRLAQSLEVHPPFCDMVDHCDPIALSDFDRTFEQKLATYISLEVKRYPFANKIIIITYDDIIREVDMFVKEVLQRGYDTFPSEGTMSHMLDGYTISILADVCNTSYVNAHVMGESVRRLIELRKTYPKWLPSELQLISQGSYPLIGHSNSPLTEIELKALHQYLGSRRDIYVHILLNGLFELSKHDDVVRSHSMTEQELLMVCKSGWLYLFLFASLQNDPYCK